MRGVSQLSALIVLAACAGAKPQPSPEAQELRELRAQLDAQSSMVAQQQRRIEDLEVKLAAISAKQQQPAPPAPQQQAAPVTKEPRPQLKTVKLGSGRRKPPATHLADSAPPITASVELHEPDDDQLARLDADPSAVKEFDADRQWAQAVNKLNNGEHKAAEQELLAFAAAHPQHSAADNALYLAGLVRESRGDCANALPLFESVPKKYPAGDAVPMAMLERGRCLQLLGKPDEAKKVLQQLVRSHEGAPEAQQAKLLLLN